MDRVWVVGNISLDVILGGIKDFPGWGVEVLIPGYVMRPGGAAANAALALTSLGVPNFLVGVVGNDFAGRELTRKLGKGGVDLSFLDITKDAATGLSVAITHTLTLERTFLTDLGAQALLTLDHLERVLSEVGDGDFLLLCGYFLSPGIRKGEDLVKLLEAFRKKGVKLLLDTGWPTEGFTEEVKKEVLYLLSAFDYFLPNQAELQALTGDNLDRIFETFSGTLVVKRGKEGSQAVNASGSIFQEASLFEAKDTIGAGDYFNAGFLFALLSGKKLDEALRVGNLVAGYNIATDSAREELLTREKLEEMLRSK